MTRDEALHAWLEELAAEAPAEFDAVARQVAEEQERRRKRRTWPLSDLTGKRLH